LNFSPVPSGWFTVRTSMSPELSAVTDSAAMPHLPIGIAAAANS
jgi:hypothetical protein